MALTDCLRICPNLRQLGSVPALFDTGIYRSQGGLGVSGWQLSPKQILSLGLVRSSSYPLVGASLLRSGCATRPLTIELLTELYYRLRGSATWAGWDGHSRSSPALAVTRSPLGSLSSVPGAGKIRSRRGLAVPRPCGRHASRSLSTRRPESRAPRAYAARARGVILRVAGAGPREHQRFHRPCCEDEWMRALPWPP